MGFKAVHFTKVKAEKAEEHGYTGVQVRWLITKEDDAKNFAMRCFRLSREGSLQFTLMLGNTKSSS